MTITVGGLTITNHQQLPVSHAGDAVRGLTARTWPVQAILTPAEWVTLNGIYLSWRNARLADPDTMVSLSVGSTVSTSGSVWGLSWSNVAAWFTAPPVAAAAGALVSVSFELIDAAQQLAIMLRESELSTQISDDETTVNGTYTLGTLTLNLTANANGFEDGPTLELAGTGSHVVKGPLMASKVKRITGWTHAAGADATARTWYETQIATTPAVNAWFPVSPPTVEQQAVIVGGAKVTRSIISVDLKQVR